MKVLQDAYAGVTEVQKESGFRVSASLSIRRAHAAETVCLKDAAEPNPPSIAVELKPAYFIKRYTPTSP